MKPILALVITAFFALPATAQESVTDSVAPLAPQVDEMDLSQFLWKKRVLVVFADSPGDPRFVEQMRLLSERPEDLLERDVVLLLDTDPAEASELRVKFRPRGFMLVLVGKDGNVYLRKPLPWNVREISRSIDKMPLRQQEIDMRRGR
ncbi:DUF4174 domain-containing protein [Marimonas lutisalis]|uniref:DUF4174 domain-containing protein n=1 Tax=Marimonas lutisalis TaxID=2545756 RepID=UPI0010FA2309|nr:DUF4174 domain-containing protein [Marimonas lutisalis]